MNISSCTFTNVSGAAAGNVLYVNYANISVVNTSFSQLYNFADAGVLFINEAYGYFYNVSITNIY